MSENGIGDVMVLQSGASLSDGDRLRQRDMELAKRAEALRSRMSPPGALGLDAHLEARRLEYLIPDSAFKLPAVYDRVLVLQVEEGAYKNNLVAIPEQAQMREQRRAPIGIIISAGLRALDILASHGMKVGDKIIHTNAVPFFVRFDNIEGVDKNLVLLKVGQISVNYDLAERLRTREIRIIVVRPETGNPYHAYVDDTGRVLEPQEVEG